MAKPNDSDLALLIDYVCGVPHMLKHVPGRGDMEAADEYRIIVTGAQRDWIVDALRHYNPSRM